MADAFAVSAEAPFFAEVADGPAVARWITATDNVRLRAVHWAPEAPKGTVLIFNGRTEYAEKYGRVAADLVARGYAVLTLDWRGQGLSHRSHRIALTGHVDEFSEYQRDVDALLDHADRIGLPRPFHLLAHSMGGCIGLRTLIRGGPIHSACFLAPMWGIMMSGSLRAGAWALSTSSRLLGLSHLPAPGRSATIEDAAEAAEANMLTRDADSFDWVRRQVTLHPQLGLGDPSLHWLHEALLETRALAALPSPDVHCLTMLGTEEWVVDSVRIRQRMSDWPGAEFLMIEGGRHELLIDSDKARGERIDRIVAHIQSAP